MTLTVNVLDPRLVPRSGERRSRYLIDLSTFLLGEQTTAWDAPSFDAAGDHLFGLLDVMMSPNAELVAGIVGPVGTPSVSALAEWVASALVYRDGLGAWMDAMSAGHSDERDFAPGAPGNLARGVNVAVARPLGDRIALLDERLAPYAGPSTVLRAYRAA